MQRIEYAGSVHGEEEIEAVVEVLRGGPTALRIGKNVKEMERLVAESFGKRRGIMVNSGSSALYLAVELLGLEPGDEIITSAVTFSTDIAPMLRSGLVPVFVDVTPDSYQIDVDQIESSIGPRTKAILAPNLIGNCPDWDAIRSIADRHDLQVVEDSCDCLGATLRGTPTGTRSDISLTSFALSHIITAAGTGGMLCLDDSERVDKALLMRRWGRRSEVTFFGSKKGQRSYFSDLDGLEYDDLFIFDELGWNFEPSELSAAFGCVQMRKLEDNLARRRRNFDLLEEGLGRHSEIFVLPRLTPGVETGWHMFPCLIRPDSSVNRGEFQQHMEKNGVDTRMVWSGNATRQPAFKNRPHRVASGGLPNADRVMECGLILPCNHGIEDVGIEYMLDVVEQFFQ
ncbi:aminotransferase class I/II-fold pyridoxal phosphate-dependent enzyme [Myxococcota bacterium]|nr:aminotransferase class I/II-fold pyridoxal phosphate-dependent enzyme [Myxococcota bacterium]